MKNTNKIIKAGNVVLLTLGCICSSYGAVNGGDFNDLDMRWLMTNSNETTRREADRRIVDAIIEEVDIVQAMKESIGRPIESQDVMEWIDQLRKVISVDYSICSGRIKRAINGIEERLRDIETHCQFGWDKNGKHSIIQALENQLNAIKDILPGLII